MEPDEPQDILGARALAVLGDSVTTDHISPAGEIIRSSPGGSYLLGRIVRHVLSDLELDPVLSQVFSAAQFCPPQNCAWFFSPRLILSLNDNR